MFVSRNSAILMCHLSTFSQTRNRIYIGDVLIATRIIRQRRSVNFNYRVCFALSLFADSCVLRDNTLFFEFKELVFYFFQVDVGKGTFVGNRSGQSIRASTIIEIRALKVCELNSCESVQNSRGELCGALAHCHFIFSRSNENRVRSFRVIVCKRD